MKDARQVKIGSDQLNVEHGMTVDIIGTRIREYRAARGQSIEETAAKAGVTPAFLEAVESGKEDPVLTDVNKIALSLDVSLADLFSTLSPQAVIVAKAWESAPPDLQEAVKTVMAHTAVKA